jgi:DNA-directed RNA polymerase subunit RPC12/RpoP
MGEEKKIHTAKRDVVETITYCFECQGCGDWIESESDPAGETVRCNHCGAQTLVTK